jgi:hypothetical protein
VAAGVGVRGAVPRPGPAHGWPATVLHLLRKDNAKARARAKRQGHQQHALGKNPFQLGASFVFEPGNRDAYVHRAETFGDNAPVEELIAALTVHDENDDTE